MTVATTPHTTPLSTCWAALLARPLEDLEVAGPSRGLARLVVPRAALLARPLEDLEVAVPSRIRARASVPRAALLARPLEDLEVAAPGRDRADTETVAAPPHCKLQQRQVALASRVLRQAVWAFTVLIQELARLLGLEDDRGWGLPAGESQRQCGVQCVDMLLEEGLQDGRDIDMEQHLAPPVWGRVLVRLIRMHGSRSPASLVRKRTIEAGGAGNTLPLSFVAGSS